MTDEVFRRVGLGYRYEPEGKNISFAAEFVKRRDGDLWAVVEVRADRPGLPRNVAKNRINLTGGRGKTDLAVYCLERSGSTEDGPAVPKAEWLGLIESFARRIDEAESEGAPLQWVGLEEPPSGSPFVVERLVESGAINYLYGPGSQGKSWIERALLIHVQLGIPFCGLAVKQMDTLHADYEASRDQDTRRVRAILRGLGAPFQAFRRWEPTDTLLRSIGPLGRILDSENIGLYGVDSAGHAAGSPGEHGGGGWEDAALSLGRALKALPGTPVVLDHVTAEASVDKKLAGRMSGAIRKFTDAQGAVWEVRKSQERENSWLVAGLYHTKGNNGVLWRPMGIRINFESDVWGRALAVRFERDDAALYTEDEQKDRQPPRDRITAELMKVDSMTAYEISEVTGIPVKTVLNNLKSMERSGQTSRADGSDEGSGGRGHVQRWQIASGNKLPASLPPNTPHPAGSLENFPPSPTASGSSLRNFPIPAQKLPGEESSGSLRNGTGHEPEGASVWGGDATASDDDEVF